MTLNLKSVDHRLSQIFFIVCLGIFPTFAQNAQVSGIVRDPSSASVPNASIVIENTETKVRWEMTTNGEGVYTAPSLPPGNYRVTTKAAGFERHVVEPLRLEVAAKISLDLTLKVGNEAETISVSEDAVRINTTDGAVSTAVDQEFVKNIPLNGRSLQSLLTAVPGVTAVPTNRGQGFSGELSVNGMRTEANYYTVDGVSMNTGASSLTPGWGAGFAGSTPSQTVLGTTQSLISVEALRELRVTTSTYSAEYGRTPGGQFSLSSRSGTNEWHGSLFEYLRNDVLDANDWFTNQAGLEKPRTRQNDFGGTFGGPVRLGKWYDGRNRTFFFVSYEGLRLRAPQSAVTTVVPGPTMRATAPAELRQFLNAFPVSTAAEDPITGFSPYVAAYSNPSSLNATSVRLDHSFNDKVKLFGRYSYSPSSTSSRSANDLANVTNLDGSLHSGTAGLTWILSPRIVNDFRANVTNTRQASTSLIDNFGGAKAYSTAGIPGYPGSSGDWLDFYLYYDLRAYFSAGAQAIDQRQVNLVDTMTGVVGRHVFKWGVDYRRIHSQQQLPPVYSFPMYFELSELMTNSPGWSSLEKFASGLSPVYTNFSAFLQDEWKASSRLNISAGVRWDVNPAPSDAAGNDPYTVNQITDLSTTTVVSRGTQLWKTRYSNFSPRLGVAYQIGRRSGYETVLRGGVGTFFDMGNTAGSMGYFGLGIAALQGGAGTPYPFTQADVNALQVTAAAPYNFSVYGFDPNLKSPYAWQWNATIEQSLGRNQLLSVGYVGSAGRNLLATRFADPYVLGNDRFENGQGLYTITNASSSNYNALQARYQKSLSHGLQVLASYTWAHAIDNATSNFVLDYLQRGNADIDVRHNGQITLTYLTGGLGSGVARSLTKDWGIDSRVTIRSALPVDIVTGQTFLSNGSSISLHPNHVAGTPVYVTDPKAAGGRRLNFDAFVPATDADGNPIEGNIGRNYARGFSAIQADLAVRREFSLRERLKFVLRAEAFNVFNHPVFGSIYNDLSLGSDSFGRAYNLQNRQLGGLNSLYQTGGPRSIQISLKLQF